MRLEHDVEEMNALIGQMLEIARGLNTETARDFELCGWPSCASACASVLCD